MKAIYAEKTWQRERSRKPFLFDSKLCEGQRHFEQIVFQRQQGRRNQIWRADEGHRQQQFPQTNCSSGSLKPFCFKKSIFVAKTVFLGTGDHSLSKEGTTSKEEDDTPSNVILFV